MGKYKKKLRNLELAKKWWMHNHSHLRMLQQDQVVLNKELLQENDAV